LFGRLTQHADGVEYEKAFVRANILRQWEHGASCEGVRDAVEAYWKGEVDETKLTSHCNEQGRTVMRTIIHLAKLMQERLDAAGNTLPWPVLLALTLYFDIVRWVTRFPRVDADQLVRSIVNTCAPSMLVGATATVSVGVLSGLAVV
jgi:hypothetical protein